MGFFCLGVAGGLIGFRCFVVVLFDGSSLGLGWYCVALSYLVG